MASILTLPIDLVYRILDKLDELDIFLSVHDVCTRLNLIIDTYNRYQVNVLSSSTHYRWFLCSLKE